MVFAAVRRVIVACVIVLACAGAVVPEQLPRLPNGQAPNVVFLICESIDGRTFREGGPVPLPSIRNLSTNGVLFENHYAAAPVCCPSRAAIWSGRHVHHIEHEHNNIQVNGAWNNYEGLAPDYDNKIGDVLNRTGANVKISGKTDWTSGGHAPWNWLQFWTMYTDFPYNTTEGGWNEQPEATPLGAGPVCDSYGTITPGKESHSSDWAALNQTTKWIKDTAAPAAKQGTPFFAYQGMNIVHPPYTTSQYWFDQIDDTMIEVPEWENLEDMHPCAFQMTMLKGCIPDQRNETVTADFYSMERRKRIRRIYYAMIAEFDAMVGRYVEAVQEAGLMDSTYFIVTADHGDMNMEHQQFYKMVPYDASALVPLVISGPGAKPAIRGADRAVVSSTGEPTVALRTMPTPTSHVDIFPTIMDMMNVPKAQIPAGLDGNSLLPVLQGQDNPDEFVVAQGHMADIATSWYLVRDGDMKLIVHGTPTLNEPQLFNLTSDPGEMVNLAKSEPDLVASLSAKITSVVNMPATTQDVAQYNLDMFNWWAKNEGTQWRSHMTSMLPWQMLWEHYPGASDKALDAWLAAAPEPKACRGDWVYPPPE